MLQITKVKKESNTLGLRVAALVRSLDGCDSLGVFESNFKERTKLMISGNHLHVDTLYRTRYENRYTNNEKLLIIKQHYQNGEQIIFTITK